MQIGSTPYISPEILTVSMNSRGVERGKSGDLTLENSPKEVAAINSVSSGDISGKPDLKEAATEMLKKPQKLGEFKSCVVWRFVWQGILRGFHKNCLYIIDLVKLSMPNILFC